MRTLFIACTRILKPEREKIQSCHYDSDTMRCVACSYGGDADADGWADEKAVSLQEPWRQFNSLDFNSGIFFTLIKSFHSRLSFECQLLSSITELCHLTWRNNDCTEPLTVDFAIVYIFEFYMKTQRAAEISVEV